MGRADATNVGNRDPIGSNTLRRGRLPSARVEDLGANAMASRRGGREGKMAELRLVGVSEDGEHLVLIDDSGVQHTIVIDERLRAGVHGHLSRLGQLTMALESRISPREIQNRVRGGESAEHVAQTAGVPVERVLRFVGPVLREREHVSDQARRARLAGTNGPSPLLGDLVSAAASRRGIDADDVGWDSARREDHTWVVSTAWPDGSAALWGLDLLRHQATPLDAAARKISGLSDDGSDAVSSAPVRGFPDFGDFAGSPDFARFDAGDDTATDDDDASPAGARRSGSGRRSAARRDAPASASRSDGPTSPSRSDGPTSPSRSDGPTSPSRSDGNVHRLVPRTLPIPVEEGPVDEPDDDSPTADSTDDIGDIGDTADHVSAAADEDEDEAGVSGSELGVESSPGKVPGRRSPSSRGSRRAAVPTWDDIMFGMKPKDGS
jgi:Protein of unknown function (DUF3071)